MSLLGMSQRVSNLMEPDRDLDARIMVALDPENRRMPSGDKDSHFPQSFPPGSFWYVPGGNEHDRAMKIAPKLTESLDDAMKMARGVLPSRSIGLRGGNSVWADHAELAGAEIWEGEVITGEGDTDAFDELDDDNESFTCRGTSPARAITAAFLSAAHDEKEKERELREARNGGDWGQDDLAPNAPSQTKQD